MVIANRFVQIQQSHRANSLLALSCPPQADTKRPIRAVRTAREQQLSISNHLHFQLFSYLVWRENVCRVTTASEAIRGRAFRMTVSPPCYHLVVTLADGSR